MKRIALISTPWPLFNRPSIQLGTLKAYLKANIPSLSVDNHHIYLGIAAQIGYDFYKTVSERTWLAESLFAGLLYPDRSEIISRFWRKRTSQVPAAKTHDFQDICRSLRVRSAELLDRTPWDRYALAGVSICFGQLTSSLYFILEIKKRAPHIKVVAGGSACAGMLGRTLLTSYPEIDFVIRGEGELPLLHLVNALTRRQGAPAGMKIPGLLSRDDPSESEGVSQISDLDELPLPDYSDYFQQLTSLEPEKTFLPRIPMEISRGCWWRKPVAPGRSRGCAFCNLNLQWEGYRAKSTHRTLHELDTLTQQYQILSVSFMDNLLPARGLQSMFSGIRKLGKDFRLFSEIRATTSRPVLEAMGSAGMREVQVGIEALSSGLLRKLNKGTTSIQNIEIMKNCETPGLPNLTGNLILHFPSSNAQDASQTLRNLDFVFPFRPLKGIPFWLGYDSPVFQNPTRYGIRGVRNHPYYGHLFPKPVLQKLRLMIQAYQGGIRHQHRIWKPVKQKLEAWRKSYLELHQTPGLGPILSFQDGLDFMIIRQRQSRSHDMTHRLRGTSRKIYRFCETRRSMPQILSNFPRFGEEEVGPFLRMMVDKRLMFNEGNEYLSLAVPSRSYARQRD
jgi:ribosomal peptide maturation radical SAM protein 1